MTATPPISGLPLPRITAADWRELLLAAAACVRSGYAARYRAELLRAVTRISNLDAQRVRYGYARPRTARLGAGRLSAP